MNCLAEALGLALPGNGTILAVSPERREFVKQSAQQLMELIEAGHQAARYRDARSDRQCVRARHGDGRIHEHRAAYAGDRA